MTNAHGKSINPEWKADSPRIFWIYKGKTISAPIIAMLVTPDKMAATVKTFDLKRVVLRKVVLNAIVDM